MKQKSSVEISIFTSIVLVASLPGSVGLVGRLLGEDLDVIEDNLPASSNSRGDVSFVEPGLHLPAFSCSGRGQHVLAGRLQVALL